MILNTLQRPGYYHLAPSAYRSEIEKPCFHPQICERISGMALAVIIEDLLCPSSHSPTLQTAPVLLSSLVSV